MPTQTRKMKRRSRSGRVSRGNAPDAPQSDRNRPGETRLQSWGGKRSHVGSLERGKNTPNIETIFKLLPTLKVSFAEYAALFESTLRVMHKERNDRHRAALKKATDNNSSHALSPMKTLDSWPRLAGAAVSLRDELRALLPRLDAAIRGRRCARNPVFPLPLRFARVG
jgi:transcriptional regulator with XRE-family HTH domain